MKKIKVFAFSVFMGCSVFSTSLIPAYCSEAIEKNIISETDMQNRNVNEQESQETEKETNQIDYNNTDIKRLPPDRGKGH